MKKYAIIAAFALGAYGQAQAQTPVVKEVTMDEVKDTAAVEAYFTKNPSDTLRYTGVVVLDQDGVINGTPVAAGDTLDLVISCYVENGNTIYWQEDFTKRVTVLTSNRDQLAAAIDTVTVKTRFAGGLNMDPKLRYDVIYAESDLYDKTDGKPLLRYGRKDGLNLLGGVGYQFSNSVRGLDFYAGLSYVTKKRLKFEVIGGGTRMEMVNGSDQAGQDYMAYYTQATVAVQPFKFDRYDQWRVWVEGGMRLCFYNTGWQGNIQSAGSSISPVVGITAAHRFFATRHMIAFNLSGYMLPKVYTNDTSHRDWGILVSARYYFNVEKGFWKAKTKR